MCVCLWIYVCGCDWRGGVCKCHFFQVLCQAIEWKMRLLQSWVVVVEKSTENGSWFGEPGSAFAVYNIEMYHTMLGIVVLRVLQIDEWMPLLCRSILNGMLEMLGTKYNIKQSLEQIITRERERDKEYKMKVEKIEKCVFIRRFCACQCSWNKKNERWEDRYESWEKEEKTKEKVRRRLKHTVLLDLKLDEYSGLVTVAKEWVCVWCWGGCVDRRTFHSSFLLDWGISRNLVVHTILLFFLLLFVFFAFSFLGCR